MFIGPFETKDFWIKMLWIYRKKFKKNKDIVFCGENSTCRGFDYLKNLMQVLLYCKQIVEIM